MFLLVGLGNPGKQFAQTRHNVGFRVLDGLVKKLGFRWRRKGKILWSMGLFGSKTVYFIKPLTFMNQSGEGLRFFLPFTRDFCQSW
ncbi:MAG: hypothetical protein ACUVQZ_06685 [Candidatus Caldatribacteriaceae bacterium]